MLFDAGDAGGLADQIEQLIRSPDLAENLGNAGKERATEFTWQARHEQMMNLYADVGVDLSAQRMVG